MQGSTPFPLGKGPGPRGAHRPSSPLPSQAGPLREGGGGGARLLL